MPLSEAEELELLELEEQEAGAKGGVKPAVDPQAEAKPWFEAGPIKIEKSPLDVDWLKAAGEEVTKPLPPGAMTVGDNPVLNYSTPQGLPSAIAKGVGNGIKGAAETFATSPIPGKIADSTNVVGAAKNAFGKLTNAMGDNLPGPAKKIVDFMSGAVGRKAAYSNPVSAVPQAISDGARAVQGAQSAVAKLLDTAPQTLGKFAPVLQKAAQGGAGSLAMTHFLLSQKDPEYQKIMKEQSGQ